MRGREEKREVEEKGGESEPGRSGSWFQFLRPRVALSSVDDL